MFFSVFLRFSACRNKTVILGFLALFAVWPSFGGVYLFICLRGAFLSPCSGSRLSALVSRLPSVCWGLPLTVWRFPSAAVSRARPVSVAGYQAGAVCQGQGRIIEQVFDQALSNKCSKQVFDCVFGWICQKISNRILTEFRNPDRILEYFQPNRTESRTESVCQSNRV